MNHPGETRDILRCQADCASPELKSVMQRNTTDNDCSLDALMVSLLGQPAVIACISNDSSLTIS